MFDKMNYVLTKRNIIILHACSYVLSNEEREVYEEDIVPVQDSNPYLRIDKENIDYGHRNNKVLLNPKSYALCSRDD